MIAALFWGGYVLVKAGGPLLFGRRQPGESSSAKAIVLSGLAILALFLVDQAVHGRF